MTTVREEPMEHPRGEAFLAAIEHNLEGLSVAAGAAPGCAECLELPEDATAEEPGDDWHDLANEPAFSWSACDSCGSTFGGSRYPAHGIPVDENGHLEPTDEVIHLDVCTDCLMFHANGDTPETWYRSPHAMREAEGR